MRKLVAIFCMVVVGILPHAGVVHAADFAYLTVTPVVFDKKAMARDILKEELKIVNTSNQKIELYPAVNDVHQQEGEQEFTSAQDASDLAASLANWIELSRGVIEISPGEEKVIPFIIRVNLNAIPGTYHANISFYQGSNRAEAESREPYAQVAVNMDIAEDIKEELQLLKFFTDNVFFSGDDVLFNYQLENIGNKELEPKGEIRIYDRRGKEVASLEVNRENKAVSPDQVAQLASVWSAASGFGKYKALINVDFGKNQKASVQDTVFFWVIPWQQLLVLFTVSLLLIIGMSLYLLRVFEARHHMALAHASAHPAPLGAAAHAVSPPVPKVPTPASSVHIEAEPRAPRVPLMTRAKSAFAFFKREARHASVLHASPVRPKQSLRDALAQTEPVAREPERVDLSPRPVQVTVREPAPREHGGTIDLKNMTQSSQREPAREVGHVINLKNHQ